MLRGELRSMNWTWEIPMAAMMLNMTQKRPLTIACGSDAKRPPNLPADKHICAWPCVHGGFHSSPPVACILKVALSKLGGCVLLRQVLHECKNPCCSPLQAYRSTWSLPMTDRMMAMQAPICTTLLLPTRVSCRHPMFSLSAPGIHVAQRYEDQEGCCHECEHAGVLQSASSLDL